MWPCWFGLALLKTETSKLIFWYILFLIGSFLMRSAGCIINDIIDIDFDQKVTRTKFRPLASKKISITEAILLLIILLVISFFILLEFNFKSIVLGLLSVPFVILYPFMKRITFFPQLFLGIIFSWGVLIVSMQFNTRITFDFLLLYFVCIFWTLAYDTIYAYQDRSDDVLNKIKSTAVYFDKNGKRFVQTCYLIILIILSYFVWNSSNFLLSSIIIATIAICTYIAIQKWDITSPLSSNYYFRQNNIFAIMLFLLLHTF
jgi:4-hydroxybenzoate polyprenyl transferase